MRYFLVDTENIDQYNFIEDLELSHNDTIIMFTSENSKNIRVTDLKRFTTCSATIEYEDVQTGNTNALDFQLIANLSLLIGTKGIESIEYIIVSNDNDFLLPIKYLKNKTKAQITILKTNINNDIIKSKLGNTDIDCMYKDLDLDDEIISILKESTALDKLHNTLRTKFGNEKGREIYTKVKPYFKSTSA